ncbi:hypothetical protein [Hirschia maritima]|uniref:hypothetical protein n=1 Tax=Hirschia maritima TaxID=1121961 RepID=UPI00037C3C15|nr:hypothetical protein [Hirschia maritima]
MRDGIPEKSISEANADEVLRRFGEVSFRAQVFEQTLENTVWGMLKAKGESSRERRDELEGQSLGMIYRRVEKIFRDQDPVWADNIKAFIRCRNYLAHTFFVDASEIHNSEEIRLYALHYLDEFEKACATASFHLYLLTDALGIMHAGRFTGSIETRLANSQGVTRDTIVKFKRFKPNA